MILTTLAICAASTALGYKVKSLLGDRRERRRRRIAGLNHFAYGLVLPAVDDPRWQSQPGPCYKGWNCIRQTMVLGKIRCCMDHGVTVSDMGIEQTWPDDRCQLLEYARAVRRAVLDRKVQESIDESQHPQLETIR